MVARAALLLLSVLVGATLVEVAVRGIYGDRIVLFPRYHAAVQYGQFVIRRVQPNASFVHRSVDGIWKFSTNKRGFRDDRDIDYPKPDGEIRVLAIGDSHTQGFEVRQSQTYSAVMERYARAHGVNARVLNAGVSGFSTAEAVVFLENEGIRYHPDVFVIGFFANDFEDNLKSDLFRIDESGALVTNKTRHTPGTVVQEFIYGIGPLRWLSENSYAYSFLFNTVWDLYKSALAKRSVENVVEFAVPTRAAVSDYQLRLAAALLVRAAAFCTTHGIRLVVLDIPQLLPDGGAGSSLPAALADVVAGSGASLVRADDVLGDWRAVIEAHVPHGHRHISEFTHLLLGVTVGRMMGGWFPTAPLSASLPAM
jgi:hypothetical protein